MIDCIIFTLEGCHHCEKVKTELNTLEFVNVKFRMEPLGDDNIHIYNKYCSNKTLVKDSNGNDIEVPEIVAPNFFFFEKGKFLGNIAGLNSESLRSVLEQINNEGA